MTVHGAAHILVRSFCEVLRAGTIIRFPGVAFFASERCCLCFAPQGSARTNTKQTWGSGRTDTVCILEQLGGHLRRAPKTRPGFQVAHARRGGGPVLASPSSGASPPWLASSRHSQVRGARQARCDAAFASPVERFEVPLLSDAQLSSGCHTSSPSLQRGCTEGHD
jgi:hypothetical protein